MPSRACPFESDRGHHNEPRKAQPFSVFFEEHTSVLSLSSGSFHKVTHRRSWRPAAVIALLVLFHVVANFVWLQQDGRTLYGDPGNHARVSLAIFDIVRRPGLSLPAQIIDATTFWPPFPYFLSQPLYALFGIGTDVTVFTTTSFLALLALAIIFTCLLGRRLYGVPAGLLATYDSMRPKLGGMAVAQLEHGHCTGCRLQLPASEIDRIKHQAADEIVTCEQCGRILVR